MLHNWEMEQKKTITQIYFLEYQFDFCFVIFIVALPLLIYVIILITHSHELVRTLTNILRKL